MPNQTPVAPPTPWYRQFWPWFLVGILASSVIGSMLMIHLALRTQDGVVVDYYRKDGRAYREDRSRDLRARQLGLSAVLTERDSHFALELDGPADELPAQLTLRLIHPTQAHLDTSLTLHRTSGAHYRGNSGPQLAGRRSIHLTPPDETWRIQLERAWFPLQSSVQLRSRRQAP